jgi:hypothetical protein
MLFPIKYIKTIVSYDVHFTGSTSIGIYGISTNLACAAREIDID